MRILLLNDDFPPRGTSSVGSIASTLATEYRRQGHTVGVITTHRGEESTEILREGDRVSLPSSFRLSLKQYHCLWSPHMTTMLRREIAAFAPDVVHAHNIHLHLTYDALRIARSFTPRVFLTTHDVMSFAFGRLATQRFLASQGHDTRLTILDHLAIARLEWNPLRNLLIRRTLRNNVTKVVAVSDALSRALTAHGISHVTTIHNGIDLKSWEMDPAHVAAFRSRFGLEGRRVILFGGRLSLDKGSTPLLQALDRLRRHIPNVLLLAIGEERRWNGLTAAAKVPPDLAAHWRCTGWLDREEIQAAFFACDIVTTPSLCLDTFNLMNIEAMAAGKPVVATLFGGSPEVVENGVTGFVRDPRSKAYGEALRILLEDPLLAQQMGKVGRMRVETHFTNAHMAQRYLSLFSETH